MTQKPKMGSYVPIIGAAHEKELGRICAEYNDTQSVPGPKSSNFAG